MRSWKSIGALLLCLVLLVNCGGGPAVVKTSAADINLSVEDVGADSSLTQEQLKDQVTSGWPEEDLQECRDGNFRLFQVAGGSTASTGILVINSADEAKDWVAGTLEGLVAGITTSRPEATFNGVDAPMVGEEAVMAKGVDSADGTNFYVVVFRQANVVATVTTMAMDDATALALINDLCARLEAQVR